LKRVNGKPDFGSLETQSLQQMYSLFYIFLILCFLDYLYDHCLLFAKLLYGFFHFSDKSDITEEEQMLMTPQPAVGTKVREKAEYPLHLLEAFEN
jgi:hypothetical protein